jgi:hypothetical protein
VLQDGKMGSKKDRPEAWQEEIFLNTSQEIFMAWLVAHIRALPKKDLITDRGLLKPHLARDGPLLFYGTSKETENQPIRIDGLVERIDDAVTPPPETYVSILPSGELSEPFEMDAADVSIQTELETGLIEFDIRPIAAERIQVIASCRLAELREFFYDLLAEIRRVYCLVEQPEQISRGDKKRSEHLRARRRNEMFLSTDVKHFVSWLETRVFARFLDVTFPTDYGDVVVARCTGSFDEPVLRRDAFPNDEVGACWLYVDGEFVDDTGRKLAEEEMLLWPGENRLTGLITFEAEPLSSQRIRVDAWCGYDDVVPGIAEHLDELLEDIQRTFGILKQRTISKQSKPDKGRQKLTSDILFEKEGWVTLFLDTDLEHFATWLEWELPFGGVQTEYGRISIVAGVRYAGSGGIPGGLAESGLDTRQHHVLAIDAYLEDIVEGVPAPFWASESWEPEAENDKHILSRVIWFSIIPVAPTRIEVTAISRIPELEGYLDRLLADIRSVYGIEDQHVGHSRDKPRKVGRPRLTEKQWEERFQTVRDVQRKSEELGITLEQACARIGVPYSTFRGWRRKMTE